MIYRKQIPRMWVRALIVITVLFLKTPDTSSAYSTFHVDTPYQQIEIIEHQYEGLPTRFMLLNGGFASAINLNSKISEFGYIRHAVAISEEWQQLSAHSNGEHILVIGAAWFTYPEEMAQKPYVERIDTIDVDAAVKRVAEDYFLQKPLDAKVAFFSQSARWFIWNRKKQDGAYETILVDAYNGTSIPEELVTREFFSDLSVLSPHVILNMIMDMKMESDFAQNLMATLTASWPNWVWYKNVSDGKWELGNFLITSAPFNGAIKYIDANWKGDMYTDDKHTVETDKAAMFYIR